jgi:hypothetical protein
MTRTGTSHFVTFERACDYYRAYDPSLTPVELRQWVRGKVNAGEIHIGIPDLKPGERLSIIDDGCRYAIETP